MLRKIKRFTKIWSNLYNLLKYRSRFCCFYIRTLRRIKRFTKIWSTLYNLQKNVGRFFFLFSLIDFVLEKNKRRFFETACKQQVAKRQNQIWPFSHSLFALDVSFSHTCRCDLFAVVRELISAAPRYFRDRKLIQPLYMVWATNKVARCIVASWYYTPRRDRAKDCLLWPSI